jgi:hypothetical protein
MPDCHFSQSKEISVMKNHITSLAGVTLCSASLLFAGQAHGAVALEDSYAADDAGGAPTDLGGGTFGYEINLDPGTDFSAAGHDKLVLAYSARDSSNFDDNPNNVTNVSYGGADLTEAVFDSDNGNLVTAGVFYLDDVASDGTLRIELSNEGVANYGFGLYAVDGVKDGVQDTGTARVTLSEATVTMTTGDGFFVQEAARNNQSLAGDAGDDYETLYNYNINEYRGLSQYQVTTEAGDYLAPINNTGENFRRVVTASFEAVPEPSSLALLAMGGLLIARRRRC